VGGGGVYLPARLVSAHVSNSRAISLAGNPEKSVACGIKIYSNVHLRFAAGATVKTPRVVLSGVRTTRLRRS